MLDKLESFGAIPASLPENSLRQSLEALRKITGKLPEDYSRFLLHFGATVLFDVNVVFKAAQPSPWADPSGYDSLESLYGLADTGKDYTVFEAADAYREDFSNHWLPIGSSSGDNQICLCLQGALYGQVWFWDHETDPVFSESGVISGMTRIADSFKEFIEILDSREEDNDISGVVRVDLDF